MTIFRYAIIKGLRNPMTLVFNCILPLVIVFIRPLWEGEGMMTGYGMLVLVIWAGSFLMTQGTLRDRETGALTRILAAPISMRSYLTQNLLAFMVPLTVQVTLVAVIGSLLYDWTLTFALGLFLMMLMFTVASVTMSFAWNCLFKERENNFTSFSALLTFGAMLSGAFISLEFLPEVLQHVGAIFPAFWAMRGITYLSQIGTMGVDYWGGIAALVLFSTAFLLYGGKRRMI